MKSKIISTIFTTLIILINSYTSVYADPYRSPAAKTPANLQKFYQTDLFTGSGVFTYPLKIPQGTNDITPELSLSYNSASTRDYTQRYGTGWQLSHDFIEQDINYNPANLSGYKYKLHFKGGVYDLIAANGRYYTKTETFLYIKSEYGGQGEYGAYWTVIEKDGTKYRFGFSPNSETTCSGRNTISRWNLDTVEDTHGNKIFYTYQEAGGTAYLSKIEYNNDKTRVIEFNYAANPFQRQAYIQGCSVTDVNRLSSIAVKTNNSLVRQYDLAYTTASNNQSLLQSITEKGSDGSSLPPTVFTYKPETKNINTTPAIWLNHADVDVHLEKDDVTLADVNGDGLLDIVRTFTSGGNNTWKVLLNQKNSWDTAFQTWVNNFGMDANLERTDTRLIDVTGDSLPDILKMHNDGGNLTYKVFRNTGASWNTSNIEYWVNSNSLYGAAITDTNTALIDVNGDNLPDLVKSQTGASSLWKIFYNTGNSWTTNFVDWTVPDGFLLSQTNIRLLDVNGDNLTDIVRTSYNGSNATWEVYKNKGSGWSPIPETWINNANIDAHLQRNDVLLSDVNGDGLVDIVKTVVHDGYDTWKVLLNKGNSWSTTYEVWMDDLNVDSDIPNDHVEFMDVTGDGLPDIVKGTADCACNFDTWRVWKNDGGPNNLLASVKTSEGGTIRFDYKSSTSYDNSGGDGKPDLPFPLWLIEKKTEESGMTGVHATSDITTYGYSGGYYDSQDREFRGFKTVDENLPGSMKKKYVFYQDNALKGVFAEVQTRDGQGNPYAESEYSWYSAVFDGIYTRYMESEKQYLYDGSADNPKITQTDYQYGLYGNVIKKSELGDTAINGDERHTYYEYIYNPSLWIIDKVFHTTLKNSSNNIISQTWNYYDNDQSTPSQSPNDLPATSFGDGSDGDLIVPTNTTFNQINIPFSAAAGNNSIFVNSGLGFLTNQIILLHQTQGTNAGLWEIARIKSYSGNTLTLTGPLTNSYSSSGNNKAQLIVIPQYHNVTINSGVSLSAKSWDGTTGGLLTFLSNGTLNVQGTINATGKGFRGGDAAFTTGKQGESYNGIGSESKSPNYGGGGGGNEAFQGGGGGGGGGYGSAGGNGGIGGYGSDNYGRAGGTYGTADLSTIYFGSGGGRGGRADGNVGGAAGSGGAIALIIADNLTVNTGRILVNGSSFPGNSGKEGTGGSGSGGSILLKCKNCSLGTSLVTALGAPSMPNDSDNPNGYGGAGGNGRIRIEYETSLTGSTNPAASALQHQIPNLPNPIITGSTYSENLTKGELTKEYSWLDGGTNPITTYEYDTFGNLTKKTDANNHITQYTYDTTSTYPATVKNAKNQTSSMNYNLGTGNLISQTDPNGLTTSYEYDVFGRITKEIKPYDSSTYPTTNYQYMLDGTAPEGTLVSKRENPGTAGTLDTYTWQDGFGRKIQIRSESEDPAKQIVSNTYYDPNGQIQKESVPYSDALSSTYATPVTGIAFSEMTYDPLTRITVTKNPKGDIKTISYDHNKETTIDENGHIKREYKNAYGKINKIEEVNGAETYSTTYEYNTHDELTKITDNSNNIYGFTYDTLGRRKSQSDPDMGNWTYEYDPVGNLTKKTDNRGIATNYTYDELDRRTKTDYPTLADTIYTYDGNSRIGTLTSITDVAGTLNFSYDNRLRKTQESRTINGTTWNTQYAYDSLDRVTTRTNPDGQVVVYTFNNRGEIDKLNGILNNIDYNDLGKITKKEFANGLSTNYSYNTDDFRLNKIKTGSHFDSSYTYDKVGNIKSITDNLLSKTQNFGYDDLDRLITAQETGGYNYSYQYNPIGNLTKFTKNGTPIDYTYGQSAGAHAVTSSSETVSNPTPTPTPTPSADYVFHKGINFNGNSVTIEGNSWLSMSSALSNGLSIPSGNETANTSLTPNPAVNSDTSHMLNTVIWKNNATLSLDQNLPNGNYQVYLWIMENYSDYNRKFHVKLENTQVATDIGYMPKTNWTKYGPYTASVSDGVLDIDLIKSIDSPHVMGMAIYKETITGPTPTPTPSPSPTPTATPTSTPSSNGSPYGGTPRTIPGTIQIEDFNTGGEGIAYHDVDSTNNGGQYRTSEGVDLGQFTSSQYNLGWTREGEWLKYTVNVSTTGTYTLNIRVASPNNNGKFHAEIDGVDVTGPIIINSTGGWTSWSTLSKSGINLTAGQHVLKIVMDQRSTQEIWVGDIDWISFL